MRCHAQIQLGIDLNNNGWGGARDPSTFLGWFPLCYYRQFRTVPDIEQNNASSLGSVAKVTDSTFKLKLLLLILSGLVLSILRCFQKAESEKKYVVVRSDPTNKLLTFGVPKSYEKLMACVSTVPPMQMPDPVC
jgi:hypothetical protein